MCSLRWSRRIHWVLYCSVWVNCVVIMKMMMIGSREPLLPLLLAVEFYHSPLLLAVEVETFSSIRRNSARAFSHHSICINMQHIVISGIRRGVAIWPPGIVVVANNTCNSIILVRFAVPPDRTIVTNKSRRDCTIAASVCELFAVDMYGLQRKWATDWASEWTVTAAETVTDAADDSDDDVEACADWGGWRLVGCLVRWHQRRRSAMVRSNWSNFLTVCCHLWFSM